MNKWVVMCVVNLPDNDNSTEYYSGIEHDTFEDAHAELLKANAEKETNGFIDYAYIIKEGDSNDD